MDRIYLVDETSKQLTGVRPVPFAQIGVRERADLEQWVLSNPEILGEELLVISSEFDRFEGSKRRLDVLALDKSGALVVIELKLDLARSHADLQALRYAAFCSTMTMEDVVKAHAAFEGCSVDEAEGKIAEFLEGEDLPELDDKPRIILAAGSLDDQELTSAVLWLRSFGVDISCVELKPYQTPDDGKIVLAPRVVIPIPEAREYIIGVERKAEKKRIDSQGRAEYAVLWGAIADEFNALETGFQATGNSRDSFMQVRIGTSYVHYEWMWRKRQSALDVCLHFEWPERAWSQRAADRIRECEAAIRKGVDLEFYVGPFGRKYHEARFRIPFDGHVTDRDTACQAATCMKTLIERTHPLVQQIVEDIS